MRPRSLALLSLLGCSYPHPGYDDGGGATAPTTTATATASATSTATATSTASATSTATTATTAETTTATATSTSTADASSTSEGSTTGAPIAEYSSCADARDQGETKSGVYRLHHPTIEDATIRVYCDLEMAEGGWILAGRSAPTGAPGSFGWRFSTGTLEDDTRPYSLDLAANPFPFTEVLIGDRGEGKAWGEFVYKIGVPPGLLSAPELLDGVGDVLSIEAADGWCTPPEGPTMLQHVGATARACFFFRDTDPDRADYGLLHDQLWTFHPDCELGGVLAGKQGMIMIR